MTRFVYIVGNFSQNDDIELRYSLRSVAKHHKKYHVTIVGWKPSWCEPDLFIPCKDKHGMKAYNTFNKLLTATEQIESGLHVLMCDDFILLEPHLHRMYFYDTLLNRANSGTFYGKNLFKNTLRLVQRGAKCFDVHMPFSFQSDLMRTVLTRNKANLGTIGISYQSLYADTDTQLPIEHHMNAKVGRLIAKPNYKAVSLSDSALHQGRNAWLDLYLYKKSRFEKD